MRVSKKHTARWTAKYYRNVSSFRMPVSKPFQLTVCQGWNDLEALRDLRDIFVLYPDVTHIPGVPDVGSSGAIGIIHLFFIHVREILMYPRNERVFGFRGHL